MTEPPSAPPDYLKRLERRLAREQLARQEAEAIAERGLRDAWARQRDLAMLQTVAMAANSMSGRNALLVALGAMFDIARCSVAHIYIVSGRGGRRRLRSTSIWRAADDLELAAFRRISEQTTFGPGDGFPGVVLERREAVWERWFDRSGQSIRNEAAKTAGLRTGLGIPVLVGRQVVAVLEFFSEEDLEPDQRLLDLLAQAGAQLGRAIERERSRERLRHKNRRLQALVVEADVQRRKAEAANHAKSAFLAITSHEVRTPLNAVIGLAEGLRREALPPRQADLVEGIVDAGAMLIRLLNAVLDLSSIEAGRISVAPSDFDLPALVSTAVRVWRAKAEELGLSLELDIKAAPGLIVRTDPGKVEQSVINLISNALKFTPRGGCVVVTCFAEPRASGYAVDIVVEDNGPGVSEADRVRIFQAYEQTDVGRSAGGAGLGLAICAGNMAALGGAIDVGEGALGGARFTLSFPAEPGATSGLAPAVEREVVTARLRVLAAEDNPANQRVLQVLFAPLDGVDLTFACNGREALEAVAVEPFDLVLMDANMPVMDGVQALETLRARGLQLPVYMLTANTLPSDLKRYRAAGANGVLAKPVDVGALYQLISEVAEDVAEREARAAS